MRWFVVCIGGTGLALVYSALTGPSPVRSPFLGRLDLAAQEAGWRPLRAEGLIAACIGIGIMGSLLALAVTANPAVAVATGLTGIWIPLAAARTRRDKRRQLFREAWPDALMHIISGVRSSMALPECCGTLETRGPAQLREGFSAFARTYRATANFRAGLERLRDDLDDPIADRVVAVLTMAHEVGGNDLVRVLRTTSDLIREDLRVRNEIAARWSWTITTARVAAVAPFLILLVMSVRPEAATAYASGGGMATILFGSLATALGYRLMLRAARLPQDQRSNR